MTYSTRSLWKVAFARPFARQPSKRGRNCLLHAITGLKPFGNSRGSDTISGTSCGPVGVIDPPNDYGAHVSLVFRNILNGGRPTAIGRFISEIGVKAINLMIERWTFPHVSQEGRERRFPTVANCNSPPAVIHKILKFWVIASPLHSDPNTVGRASFAANLVAVLQSTVRISHSYLNSRCPLKRKSQFFAMKGLIA